jgi:hypothetical protein
MRNRGQSGACGGAAVSMGLLLPQWSVLTGHALAYAGIVCSEVVTTFSSFRFSELSQPI